jgi:hypothetical protein
MVWSLKKETTMCNQFIETYHGVRIHFLEGEGFHASAGCAVHFGYCDTLAEITAEIDDHFEEERAHYADIDQPRDTPSLGSPWWAER